MTRVTPTLLTIALLLVFSVTHFFFLRLVLRHTVKWVLRATTGGDFSSSPSPSPSTLLATPIKIYVYDIPETLLQRNYRMTPESCPHDFYNIEFTFPKLVKQSRWGLNVTETKDATIANYFLVPNYSTCYYHYCRTKGSVIECQESVAEYMTTILDHIEESYPFWVRRQGLDHIFVQSWDWGVHIYGEVGESIIRNRLTSSIHLTLLGLAEGDQRQIFDPTKDISIPPLRDYSFAVKLPRPKERSIFAYFRGTIGSDIRYSNGLRQRLQKYGEDDPTHYFIRTQHSNFYWHELVNARYALCPAGWSHWSPRLFDAIVAGAIPVIIADEWVPAFNGTLLNYQEFSIRVAEKDIERLTEILTLIPLEREMLMRRKLEKVAHRFIYNQPPILNDALDSTLQLLARRPPIKSVPPTISFDLGNTSEGEYSNHEEDKMQSSDADEEGEL